MDLRLDSSGRSTANGGSASAKASGGVFARRLFTECLGTFILVTVDCGGAVIAALSGGEVSPAARAAATGLVVLAMVYAMGDVSGAHFNPAVTSAFALRGVFPWRHVPPYILAQLLGAVAASMVLRVLFGNVAHLGATLPRLGVARAFGIEVILSTILVGISLGVATRHRVVGANAGIAVGGTVALCALFGRPVSGASMNPAGSLGPALVSATVGGLWLYVTAPFVGAAIATLLMGVVHHRRHAEERESARGEPK